MRSGLWRSQRPLVSFSDGRRLYSFPLTPSPHPYPWKGEVITRFHRATARGHGLTLAELESQTAVTRKAFSRFMREETVRSKIAGVRFSSKKPAHVETVIEAVVYYPKMHSVNFIRGRALNGHISGKSGTWHRRA